MATSPIGAAGTTENQRTSHFESQHNSHKPSCKAALQNTRSKATVSVAIPGSIISNARNFELKNYLAGQIARTCTIFCVSEIVIYNDQLSSAAPSTPTSISFKEDPHVFLSTILEYLETPQYLRKLLFPLQPSLRLAGTLPPLDCPHHLRREDGWVRGWREGVVVSGEKKRKREEGQGVDDEIVMVEVEVGLDEKIFVQTKKGKTPPTNARVTVQRRGDGSFDLCSPTTPSVYWGYTVRYASSLSAVFSDCPYRSRKNRKNDQPATECLDVVRKGGGYDLLIGTSERGKSVETVIENMGTFKHALLIFGPLSGLEVVISKDEKLELNAEQAEGLFDWWVNVIVGQGSRTVRTEEALMIALSVFKTAFDSNGE